MTASSPHNAAPYSAIRRHVWLELRVTLGDQAGRRPVREIRLIGAAR